MLINYLSKIVKRRKIVLTYKEITALILSSLPLITGYTDSLRNVYN